jgi:hypothetical protein
MLIEPLCRATPSPAPRMPPLPGPALGPAARTGGRLADPGGVGGVGGAAGGGLARDGAGHRIGILYALVIEGPAQRARQPGELAGGADVVLPPRQRLLAGRRAGRAGRVADRQRPRLLLRAVRRQRPGHRRAWRPHRRLPAAGRVAAAPTRRRMRCPAAASGLVPPDGGSCVVCMAPVGAGQDQGVGSARQSPQAVSALLRVHRSRSRWAGPAPPAQRPAPASTARSGSTGAHCARQLMRRTARGASRACPACNNHAPDLPRPPPPSGCPGRAGEPAVIPTPPPHPPVLGGDGPAWLPIARALKRQGGTSRRCPLCQAKRRGDG